MNKFSRIAILTVLFSVPLFVQIGFTQPPPPGDGPPCWPPPCVPVDGGIVFAISAAALFGGLLIYSNLKRSGQNA
jgi:hypothetical protein